MFLRIRQLLTALQISMTQNDLLQKDSEAMLDLIRRTSKIEDFLDKYEKKAKKIIQRKEKYELQD